MGRKKPYVPVKFRGWILDVTVFRPMGRGGKILSNALYGFNVMDGRGEVVLMCSNAFRSEDAIHALKGAVSEWGYKPVWVTTDRNPVLSSDAVRAFLRTWNSRLEIANGRGGCYTRGGAVERFLAEAQRVWAQAKTN